MSDSTAKKTDESETTVTPAVAPEIVKPASPNSHFEMVDAEGYKLIKLAGIPDAEAAKALVARLPDLENPPMHILISCESVSDFSPQWHRTLMQAVQTQQKVKKNVRLIGANPTIIGSIKTSGLDRTLINFATLRAALIDLKLVASKALDVNFINPFLQGTIKVLETQAATKAKPGTPYKKAAGDSFQGDISGIIGIVSDAFSGSVVITFPGPTFLKVMSRMLGEECTTINKDIEDGAGELTNIIFGQAKLALNERGYGINTALPSVISGHNHSINQVGNGPRMVIPFETDVGPFFVEICLSD